MSYATLPLPDEEATNFVRGLRFAWREKLVPGMDFLVTLEAFLQAVSPAASHKTLDSSHREQVLEQLAFCEEQQRRLSHKLQNPLLLLTRLRRRREACQTKIWNEKPRLLFAANWEKQEAIPVLEYELGWVAKELPLSVAVTRTSDFLLLRRN
jgi:hypothetical protein